MYIICSSGEEGSSHIVHLVVVDSLGRLAEERLSDDGLIDNNNLLLSCASRVLGGAPVLHGIDQGEQLSGCDHEHILVVDFPFGPAAVAGQDFAHSLKVERRHTPLSVVVQHPQGDRGVEATDVDQVAVGYLADTGQYLGLEVTQGHNHTEEGPRGNDENVAPPAGQTVKILL